MQSEIIKELYTNFVESSELPRKYHLLCDRISANTKDIKKVMKKKHRKKLDMIVDDYEEIITITGDNAFVDGFSFAVQLMSEAYGHK